MRNLIFRWSYSALFRKEIKFFDEFVENEKLSFSDLKNLQERQLSRFISHCYYNIPYYNNIFKALSISPDNIKTVEDLNLLPILTKADILKNKNAFLPKNAAHKIIKGSTGGSTGEPLRYLMSEECYSRGVALMYRGWSRAGYKPGDKILIFAGSSLVGTTSLSSKLTKWSRNFKSISSYGVTNENLNDVINVIIKWKPKYIRGYASSIVSLAQFIINSNLQTKLQNVPLKGIFTTAEMLFPKQRALIEDAFNVKVYNQYGLNDGGISAFEGDKINGFVIDTERAIMECIDEKQNSIYEREGRLIATSIYNYAFPFLRYDTGDTGIISYDYINNGGNRLLLQSLLGRTTDYISINDRTIASPVLTVLMGKFDIYKYQIIQKNGTLTFNIDKGPTYTHNDELFIRKSIEEHLGIVDIYFKYSNNFLLSLNKHKFIINED